MAPFLGIESNPIFHDPKLLARPFTQRPRPEGERILVIRPATRNDDDRGRSGEPAGPKESFALKNTTEQRKPRKESDRFPAGGESLNRMRTIDSTAFSYLNQPFRLPHPCSSHYSIEPPKPRRTGFLSKGTADASLSFGHGDARVQ
jgi:hypothetical protein